MVEFQWFLMELSVLFGSSRLSIYIFFLQQSDKKCSVIPSRKELGDLCPAVSEPFVGLIDDSVLFLSPRRLLYFWVEVVVPSLTALLPNPSLEVLGDY